jgi:hypothetical protein
MEKVGGKIWKKWGPDLATRDGLTGFEAMIKYFESRSFTKRTLKQRLKNTRKVI